MLICLENTGVEVVGFFCEGGLGRRDCAYVRGGE